MCTFSVDDFAPTRESYFIGGNLEFKRLKLAHPQYIELLCKMMQGPFELRIHF